MVARTLYEKIWHLHAIADLGAGRTLLHVDRHLLHDLGGGRGIETVEARGDRVRNPELTFATPDHAISSAPGRHADSTELSARFMKSLREGTGRWNVKLFDLGQDGQGIVHVIGPEQGLTLPGITLVCGDSHTSTHGALGAMAWGIGTSELVHVLATQSTVQSKMPQLRIAYTGRAHPSVEPKDMILYTIGRLGAAAGSGRALEYAGPAIEAMDMEGRMTICNLSIEMGARIGMIAPDETTFAYLEGRPMAPKGRTWARALAHWRTLGSDEDAAFDQDVTIDAGEIAPQITWGTSPQDTIAVDGIVPDPARADDADRAAAISAALDYMGLEPGRPIAGTPVDQVFIGSCTNSRLGDLRKAAALARDRKVADGVTAWVVPGSLAVKRAAEAEGLDRVFLAAGFEWREPGCSRCVAANAEFVPPGQRCVSTSNRNFVGRQGPGARTHLASPTMAVAAAIAGTIADVRRLAS